MKNLIIPILLISVLYGQTVLWAEGLVTPTKKDQPPGVSKELEGARAQVLESRPKLQELVTSYGKRIQETEEELLVVEKRLEEQRGIIESMAAHGVAGLDIAVAEQGAEVIQERANVLREKIRALRDRTQSAEELPKAEENTISLMERRQGLSSEVASMPLEKTDTTKKEVEVAKAREETAQARIMEKKSEADLLKKELETVRQRYEGKKARISSDIKALEGLPFRQDEKTQNFIKKRKFILTTQLANLEDSQAVGEERLVVAKDQLKTLEVDSSNARLQVALLSERAALLEERLKAEEFRKKELEAEVAGKAEEEKKRTAEEEKAVAQRQKEEALRKAEEVAQQQLAAVSPEQRRVLELETLLYTLQGEVARKKDELITEGTKRFEDNTEYKKLARDVHTIMGGENTPSEIREEMGILDREIKKWQGKLLVVESLAQATEKEKVLVEEDQEKARSEVTAPPGEKSKIEKEAEAFEDKGLAEKLKLRARERMKYLEEESNILGAKMGRIEERRAIIREAMGLLEKAKGELSGIRAANIWARRGWGLSWTRLKDSLKEKPHELAAVRLAPAERKIHFTLALLGSLALSAAVFFGAYYSQKWCGLNLKKLHETPSKGYVKATLLPALFRILRAGATLWLIMGLSFGIVALFQIKGPLIHSLQYGLVVFSVYQVLQGFLRASLSPAKGRPPLLPLPEPLARHGYLSLHVILLYSAIFITLIMTLNSFLPENIFVDIRWRIYTGVTIALFIWVISPKPLFLKLLHSPESALRKFIRGCIHTVHPLSIAFLVLLLVLTVLGLPAMTYSLIGTAISCIIGLISVAITRGLIASLILDRIKRKRIAKGEVEADFKVTRKVIDFASVIVCIILVLSLWVATFIDFGSTPAAPGPIQAAVSGVGGFLHVAVGVLGYKLGLGDGSYTTPFKILIGLAIIALSFLIAAALKRFLQNRVLSRVRLEKGIEHTISSVFTYMIVAITVLFALSVAGVPLRSLAFFAGALGIGIGFGLQNIINNFVSGLILLFERPVRVGDVIMLADNLGGTVERIGPRSTTIITPDNIAVVVPNARLMESQIVNWSQPTDRIRVHINVGVAYGSDLELVKKCLLDVAQRHPMVRKYPEPMVRFDKFGDSALIFELIYWVDNAYARWVTLSDLNFAIDKAFRENNITIPFPQQDLHIRSVITKELPQEKRGEIEKALPPEESKKKGDQ
ncbi:MAG: mechanosensitive ion channel [Candidatus Brocadiales bacterium]|nr:mechanosensitive ion channel [Candidatus Brocadiales bacterium]